MTDLVHATAVARHQSGGPLGGWTGVLLTGPSGAGKSDLALRLLAQGWRLVCDDYCRVWSSRGALWASPPETLPPDLKGHMEVRGLGIVAIDTPLPLVRIVLSVACVQSSVERLPEPEFETLAGILVPRLSLDIRPVSAGLTLERALDRIRAGRQPLPLNKG